MEATLDLSRWTAAPKGVGYRRWVILSLGVRRLLATRFFRWILALSWISGFGIALFGFLFSQTLATGGWLETYAPKMGPMADGWAKLITGLVALYPDVIVHTIFTYIFWLHSFVALVIALVTLTLMIPGLITRDQATNALIVYLSRPLTTVDYLLGKLGTIVGVLLLVWTGPLLFGWLLSMLFATDRDFLVYSLVPLGRALLFNGLATVVLAAIALGVSALARSSLVTIVIWLVLWLVTWVISTHPQAPTWLERASFFRDLNQTRGEVFQLDEALLKASQQLPLLDKTIVRNLERSGEKVASDDANGALIGLGVLTLISSAVFFRKLKPE